MQFQMFIFLFCIIYIDRFTYIHKGILCCYIFFIKRQSSFIIISLFIYFIIMISNSSRYKIIIYGYTISLLKIIFRLF